MPKSINFNDYERVKEGEHTLKITLFKLGDGSTPPILYLKSKKAKPDTTIEDVRLGKKAWCSTVHIDGKCQPSDYIALVNWWFDSAHNDKEFREFVLLNFGDLKDLNVQIDKCQNWLKTDAATSTDTMGSWNKRVKDIKAFMTKWLRKNLRQQR